MLPIPCHPILSHFIPSHFIPSHFISRSSHPSYMPPHANCSTPLSHHGDCLLRCVTHAFPLRTPIRPLGNLPCNSSRQVQYQFYKYYYYASILQPSQEQLSVLPAARCPTEKNAHLLVQRDHQRETRDTTRERFDGNSNAMTGDREIATYVSKKKHITTVKH